MWSRAGFSEIKENNDELWLLFVECIIKGNIFLLSVLFSGRKQLKNIYFTIKVRALNIRKAYKWISPQSLKMVLLCTNLVKANVRKDLLAISKQCNKASSLLVITLNLVKILLEYFQLNKRTRLGLMVKAANSYPKGLGFDSRESLKTLLLYIRWMSWLMQPWHVL